MQPDLSAHWGRRARRLRRAAWLLVAAALAMGAAGFWIYRASRPDPWVPGEPLPEITDRLARGPGRPVNKTAGETGETAEITDQLARARSGEAPVPAWTDVTKAAGLGGFRSFAGERTSQLPEDMGAGAAWGDFDADGDEDLFLVAAGGSLSLPPETWAPSRLYENLGNGTFQPVESFPEIRILGMGAAWGDADGDGDLDLAVSGYRSLLLLRNEGGGRFSRDERFPGPDGYWAGLSWADFDRDGDLDLYVCGYVRYEPPAEGEGRTSQQSGRSVPYTLNPASFEPESNLLLANRGDGTFEDVALLWGVSNPQGRSLTALWHDFDDDGWIDLYVANDISDNALFLNKRGETFEDAGLAAWVADYRGAMGLAAGDWNRDGDDDLFVTHWVAQENALYDSRLRTAPPAAKQGLLAGGGSLPQLRFQDIATPVGLGAIALPLVGWGTEFADFDGDGWLDVVVANGSTLEDRRDRRRLEPQAPLLMWNRQGK
ncbi:MAG TPA: VCBS repeat-containing protein, partial [Vicinamibacteria bacterium]